MYKHIEQIKSRF